MALTINSTLSGVPKRKPLPDAAVVPIPESNSDLEKTTEPVPLAPATDETPSQGQKLRAWKQPRLMWDKFSPTRKRIITGALIATLVLLALIVGLAVGLTKRHGKG
ncbi:hypothetical protein ASPSYDRAFT_26790 [Aspergillus sydowii CBS 593.65]|uniref:Uncharacterized protein n=1 Tax=Aspergillus sydowii CBS 593.65 TaxID=1036612 RepID=A0A1L9TZF1_9EURO|nr:uncharacterized protein ASPSYDRAFT_26790 [Aspergillus sydowii CBS 593.65]OJJ64816.1 hypothetical protein ASPSYDRAFT_26790 [Aspergillus sydowii CBS 593.65]